MKKMQHIYEYLKTKMTFAASRKNKFIESQESFKLFKKFFVDLGDIAGLTVGIIDIEEGDNFINKTWEPYRLLFNPNTSYRVSHVDSYSCDEVENLAKHMEKITPYLGRPTFLYEIRETEPDKIVKNKTYKWVLDYLFSEEQLDIHTIKDCNDTKYLILGELDKSEQEKLQKWGFKPYYPYKPFCEFDYRQSSETTVMRKSDSFDYYFDSSGKIKDVKHLIIDFATLLKNIKYIDKQFFEIVDE